jgi:hypothetical protein
MFSEMNEYVNFTLSFSHKNDRRVGINVNDKCCSFFCFFIFLSIVENIFKIQVESSRQKEEYLQRKEETAEHILGRQFAESFLHRMVEVITTSPPKVMFFFIYQYPPCIIIKSTYRFQNKIAHQKSHK